MPQFIESIRIENGKAHNLELHQQRIDSTLSQFYPQSQFSLTTLLPEHLPAERTKWRIVYGETIEHISLTTYVPPRIDTLRLVEVTFNYEYKYLDREPINQAFAHRQTADDVLIVSNGHLTDTSFCNIAFYNGSEWLTPSSPLLRGTMRESLIKKGIIQELFLSPSSLSQFSHISLFNALNPWGEIILPITSLQNL